jgi:hypothetical protein
MPALVAGAAIYMCRMVVVIFRQLLEGVNGFFLYQQRVVTSINVKLLELVNYYAVNRV